MRSSEINTPDPSSGLNWRRGPLLIVCAIAVISLAGSLIFNVTHFNPDDSAAESAGGEPGNRDPRQDISTEVTGTLKGWFVGGQSARISHPESGQPDGATGYFSVVLVNDDLELEGGLQRVYATLATKLELSESDDPLDPDADIGLLFFVDYHRVDEAIVADRINAPLAIAY